MNLTMLRCSIPLLATAIGTLGLVSGVGAQENLDRGKTPAQLFASDCSICHKSPQGLARAGGLFGLDSFLRTHYTASRESAGAIANYLKSIDTGPAGRATRRTAKGDDKAQPADRKKFATKPGDGRVYSILRRAKPGAVRPPEARFESAALSTDLPLP